jgi:hypothetical protein
MVAVTEGAARELKAKLLAETSDTEVGLRLLPTPGGEFMLVLDTKLSGDEVIEYQDSKVLLVGIEYFRALEGVTVDCQDTHQGVVLFVK